MTVRIRKPVFDVQEKLQQVSYERFPYEKLPPGTVVQTKFLHSPTSGGAEDETFSSTFVDAPKYQLPFSPIFSNSILHIEWWTQVKTNDSENTAFYIRIVRVNADGTEIPLGGTQGSFYWDQISGSSAIRYQGVNFAETDRPVTTDSITYKLQFRSTNGSTTIRLGENTQFGKLLCKITEIRQ